jgi:hypothetical protein
VFLTMPSTVKEVPDLEVQEMNPKINAAKRMLFIN